MKFAKDNLTLLICAGVTLLILLFAFAPIPYAVPGLRDELVAQMRTRYTQALDLIHQWADTVLDLPGVPSAKGVPPQDWVDAKIALINGMTSQREQVERLARDSNIRGRLDARGVPILPVPKSADMSGGEPIPGFLPVIASTTDRMSFRDNYGLQFPRWRGLLQGSLNSLQPSQTLPPKPEDLKNAFEERQKRAAAGLPVGAMPPPGMATVSAQDAEFMKFEKEEIANRASNLHMYIEEHAFQVRDWYANTDAAPTAPQVFAALVDSWFQSDLVKAILAVNANKSNVAQSPVKRLTRVVIGNNALSRFLNTSAAAAAAPGGVSPGTLTDPGQLFFTSTNVSLPRATGTPVRVQDSNAGRPAATRSAGMVLPDTANQTNYDLGMTGRAAGKMYDVVYMSVVLDIDPAYLFKFIQGLYQQNNCYTVTNMQMRTVDPLDRAANGYLYGDPPVVEVEFLVECVLFRGWTAPLMPDDIKSTLGGTSP